MFVSSPKWFRTLRRISYLAGDFRTLSAKKMTTEEACKLTLMHLQWKLRNRTPTLSLNYSVNILGLIQCKTTQRDLTACFTWGERGGDLL